MQILPCQCPLQKGIRQRALASPPLFNSSGIEPQQKALTICIFKGIDVPLIYYAYDVLNVSRTQTGIEENFRILSDEYNRIGFNFNHSTSEILVFNRRSQDPVAVHVIQDQESLTYLGAPIGKKSPIETDLT